eukprot:CAMPEP_0118966216 /NCGR_PEP_ID=MMETSP1173-20130426/3705_1 /TAXON_ID=1034831 /ORGANISM="Rhizochromulina marina cf, Strain CCMP1243" /LENGTH=887 /DNA_ID=CAMNT_0006914961 /DNA_START=30 /DNA_END=2693 /DNA_ORIENTATION=+
MPIEINELRDYKGGDPERYRHFQKARFRPVEWVDDVLAVDQEWRDLVVKRDSVRRDINKLQKEVIAPLKKKGEKGEKVDNAIAQLKAMQEQIKTIEAEMPELEAARDKKLAKLGNVVDPEVPVSKDEDADNMVCRLSPLPSGVSLPCKVSTLEYPLPEAKPLTHDDLLWRINGFDPERGVKVAGHRGYFLMNDGVLLNQALINYAISFLRARQFPDGKRYDVLQPPYFMKKEIMSGIAQLEDYDEQLYKISGKTDDPDASSDKYMIATSEQPICGFHMGEWLEERDLPKRYAGVSTCFRKEAGSSGKDIRGIFRVHQFEKVEQFVICKDDFEESQEMQKQMLMNAEEFWQSLGVPYRVVTIVSGELNDAAVKKYDLEGWFPGQGTYRELVSCSNCTDFQSRAMGIRCGSKKMGQTSASFVHMLNSTLCATGRGICAVLENHQTPEGVVVPEPLRPFMGGIDFLPFVRGPKELSKAERLIMEKQAKARADDGAKSKPPPKQGAAKAASAPAAAAPPAAPATEGLSPEAAAVVQKITAKGDEIRTLKASKAGKEAIMAKVSELNDLKAEYEKVAGTPYVAPGQQGSSKDKKKKKQAKAEPQQQAKGKKAGKAKEQAAQKPAPPAPKSKPAEKPAPSSAAAPGLADLDETLRFQSYIAGYTPTADDATAYDAWKAVPCDGFTNVKRWLNHITSFSPAERAMWGDSAAATPNVFSLTPRPVAGSVPKPAPPAAPAAAPVETKAAEEDDEMDLFGDEEEEEEAAPVSDRAKKAAELKAKRDAEMEAKKKAALDRLAKKEAKQRSLCNLEIKPWEAEQDLMELFNKIKTTVVKEGLKWSENCALKEVAFGIKKMILTAVINQSMSMDAIIEEMLEEVFPDEIQSMEMTSMSLL